MTSKPEQLIGEVKMCKRCTHEKDLSMFAKYCKNGELLRKDICRKCVKPSKQKYYQENTVEIIANNSNYKKQNRSKTNKRERDRRKNDPVFRMRELIRGSIKTALKRSKNGVSINKYLQYPISVFTAHIENLFEPWMTWNNQGVYNPKTWKDDDQNTWTWQVDHIIPQSDLPYTSMEDDNFKKCWELSNLRPLSAQQNVKDGPSRIRHKKVS